MLQIGYRVPTVLGLTQAGVVFTTSNGVISSKSNSDSFDTISPMTTLGDIIYRGASANARLAGNTSATRMFLGQTGTGSVSAAPDWAVLLDGDIPTTLTGKTLVSPTITGATISGAVAATDSTFTIQDNSDATKIAKFECSGITTGTTRTFTFPDASDTLVGRVTSDIAGNRLQNKHLQCSTVQFVDGTDTTKRIKFDASASTTATTITLTTTTSVDRTLGIPDATDTLVGRQTSDQSDARLQNKHLDAFNCRIVDTSDTTKRFRFQLSGATTATDITLASAHTTDRTVTFPDATDTLVGKNTTDTLTNKTLGSSQPASVGTTPGTAATAIVLTNDGTGGNTTIATTGTGGAGAAITLGTGTGGTAASAVTASTGGAGGTYTFTGGAGGTAAVAGTGTNTGGIGSVWSVTCGAGGDATGATSGTNTGGAGGGWTALGGNGGSATTGSGSLVAGAGGAMLVSGGAGGAGSSGGNGGSVTLRGGTASAVGGSGGAATLQGRAGSSTGTGGAGGGVTIVAGAAGGDDTTNRNGGAISITAGASKGSSAGGAITVTSGVGSVGTGTSGAAGGAQTFTPGAGGAGSSTGGSAGAWSVSGAVGGVGAGGSGGSGTTATITAGVAGVGTTFTTGATGTVLTMGGGGNGGTGGSTTLTSGVGGGRTSGSAGAGGTQTLAAGIGGASASGGGGNGGAFSVSAGLGGAGTTTSGNGGQLSLNAGVGGTGGTPGAGGIIIFQTATTTSLTERMRINNSGEVGIGMTAVRTLDVTGTFGATGAVTLGSTLACGAITLTSSAASPLIIDNSGNGSDAPNAIQLTGGSGTGIRLRPSSGSGKYNWQIEANVLNDNSLSITPSTASGGSTFSTAVIKASATNGVTFKGTQTNDDAAASFVGETVESNIAFGDAVSLTTATDTNITSISLTAGDWDISGRVCFSGTLTGTICKGATNSTSATIPASSDESVVSTPTVPTAAADLCFSVPVKRVSLSGTTTEYLVARTVYTVGTAIGYGHIRARRVR